ncbi:MAG: prevent-host-death protein [Anaerolineae bacterium]
MYKVRLDEARDRLLQLVDAAIKGEEVFVLKDEQVVQLVPVEPPVRRRQFGSARGLIVISDDFDAPLEDFSA